MKKALYGLLTLVLLMTGIYFYGSDKCEVLAAAGDVTSGDGYIAVEYNDLTTYRTDEGNVAPTAPTGYEGYIFAGWYQDAACGTAYKTVTADTTLAYAKFVPADVLSVKCQLKGDATEESETTNMRLVSSVDSLSYTNVGYHVYFGEFDENTEPVNVVTKKVYEKVVASAESGVEYNYSPMVVDIESQYFVTATLVNIKNANFEKPFYIKPYWTTLDGTVVYGVSKYVTVANGLDATNVNLTVNVSDGFDTENLQVTIGGTTYPATVAYYDGTYAHLNVTVINRDTVLKSLNAVSVTDGTITASTEYRNLQTKYNGTADITWYDASAQEYIIATSADLYGLASIVNGGTTFGGKTVYLIADIEVNKGRATETGWSTYEEDGTTAIAGATSHVWTPIGYVGKSFSGVFDGQGHTISGLNGTPTTTVSEAYLGLFGLVGTGSQLKNFRVTNSYFEERTVATGQTNYTGSIAGRTNGNIASVYSDAYVKGYSAITGGIVGRTHSASAKTISNCCYAGKIIVSGSSANRTGGIVGQQWAGTLLLENCLFSGTLSYTGVSGNIKTGGFVGHSVTGLTIKNSLNSGKFINVDGASVTATGRVLGHNEAAVMLENVYVTNVGDNTAFWYNPGGLADGSEEPVMVEETDITGVHAYCNDILVKADEWVMTETTPALALFATELALPGNIDWYTSADATEYTICDSEDNESNIKDLYGFAYLVNQGITFAEKTVKLANDVIVNANTPDTTTAWTTYLAENADANVWTPIGTDTNEFAGTFDGQMNSISGIYVNSSEQGAALFKNTADGSAIKNLKLENSYITSTQNIIGSVVGSCGGDIENVYSNATINTGMNYVGGIVGQVFGSGNVNIKKCWFEGTVNAQSNAAGIVGVVTKGTVLIENCLNSGSVANLSNKDSAGGLLARTFRSTTEWGLDGSGTNPSTTIKNSLNSGTISGRNNIGSAIGWPQRGTLIIENVYATKTSNGASVDNVGIGSLSTDTRITMVDLDTITGLNSYYNNILAFSDEWVPTETVPAPKVFTTGLLTESTNEINIDWFEGFGTTEYTICDKNTNEANVAELYGFAYLANHGIDFEEMTVILAKDVTLNEETIKDLTDDQRKELDVWEPIGSQENKFAGTFDGGMHTISGVYIEGQGLGSALFRGTTSTSTIKNLKLKNTYIKATANFAGSFVASASGNLSNLYSEADIVTNKSYAGGIVGQTWTDAGNDITISGCWFNGSINAPSNTGGILAIGSKGNFELKDCLNTGSITYTTNANSPSLKWVGGLVGRTLRSSKEWVVTEDTTATMMFKMTNCLNTGKITNSNDKRVGSALGQNNGPSFQFTNVFTTNDSYKYDGVSTSIGRSTNGGVVKYSGIMLVETGNILAENAYYNKVLVNVEGSAWSLTTETPVLTAFVDEVTAIEAPVLNETLDISWYNGLTATTHKVCTSDDNAENVKQFYGFAYLVNQGIDFDDMTVMMENDVTVNESAVSTWNMSTKEGLTLWTPIGTDALGFAGTFDGQMNTISGICVQVGVQGAGLFRNTAHGSTLKNFKLINSYIDSTKSSSSIVGSVVGSCGGNLVNVYSNAFVRSVGAYIGGIAGQIYGSGDVSIDGCWYAGTILNKTGSSNAGGIAGVITSGNITMENCLNSGNITVAGDSVGGFFGRSFTAADRWTLSGTGSATLTIKNCLNTGAIKGNGSVGSVIGWKQKGTVDIGDAVYGTKTSTETKSSGAVNNKWIGNGATNSGEAVLVDTADIKGMSAQDVLIGLDFSTNGKWILVNDATPQLRAFAEGENVLAGDFSWYSEEATEYTIDTAEELIGFSTLAKLGNVYSGKTIKLGSNVDLNEGWTASVKPEVPTNTWTPVGTESKAFAGTFDGQGHSISGVYVDDAVDYMGFFGVTGYNSEIKNFRLLNSYFNQQATSGNGFTGSVAGELQGSMSNVYSNAIVKSGYNQIGGMVARTKTNASFTTTVDITNCWFDGMVIGGSTGRYLGGIVAAVIRGTCNMENVLFTGVIDTDHNSTEDAVYAGGIIADGKANTTTINLKSVISAGQIIGDNSGNLVHAVIGRVRTTAVSNSGTTTATAQKPILTFENVFATRECCETTYSVGSVQEGILIVDEEEVTITSEVIVTGGVLLTTGNDRLIGCGVQEVTNADGSALALDFAEAWSMRTNSVPVPTSLADMAEESTVIASVDATALAKEIGLDYWNASASIKDAIAYGAGNYLVSYTTTEGQTYAGYISKLGTLGFTKYADNSGTDMATDGVVSGTYYKEATEATGEWVLNITSVANESKIYISIGTDTKALDDNLKSATQEGSNAISLSMLEMVNTHDTDPYGNSFVFQLPNGHFVVSDGGREEDGLKLIEFLKDQAGTGNDVIIDAWIVTHYHDDHCGALNIFSNDSSLREGIYIEAIYACEPSAYALDYWENQVGVMNKALRGAMTLTKKSDGTRPNVYQLHMGQRYYFNGITMDVIDTQEQHPVATWGGANPDAFPDEFNTSSTNCVFSFTDKAGTTKKVLIGGDATTVNMEYIMDVYGTTNKTLSNIDVFAAYHHGHNMTAIYGEGTVSATYDYMPVTANIKGTANYDWIHFLLNNNDDNKFDAVLFSYNHIYRANLTYSGSLINGGRDYYYKGTDGNVDYPYNIGEINDYLASSTCTAAAYTYENGTVKITFDGSNTTKVFGTGVFVSTTE